MDLVADLGSAGAESSINSTFEFSALDDPYELLYSEDELFVNSGKQCVKNDISTVNLLGAFDPSYRGAGEWTFIRVPGQVCIILNYFIVVHVLCLDLFQRCIP